MWLKSFFRTSIFFFPYFFAGVFSAQTIAAEKPANDQVFARINDRTILYGEFMDIFRGAVRYKYYHGEVPAKELEEFQRQVGSDIVEQVLLYQDAIKFGLKPDNEKIQSGLEKYDQRYRNDPEWIEQKERVLPSLIENLKRQNLIEQMKNRIRSIPEPDQSSVRKYYETHPEKFTEPKRVWVSVILLSVPPSSMSQTWIDAEKAASQFKQRIEAGESFAEIAKEYSGHPSAVNGGDLGYLHQGMLEGDSNIAVDKLKVNEVSAPVRVLEGYTLFRLNGLHPEKLKPFEEVIQRAEGLLYRELQDKAWDDYVTNLKDSADIYINADLYESSND